MPLPCFDTEHIAKMYEARKRSVGEHTGNQYTKMPIDQNGLLAKPSTAEQIADEIGVGCHAARGSDGRYLSDKKYHLGV